MSVKLNLGENSTVPNIDSIVLDSIKIIVEKPSTPVLDALKKLSFETIEEDGFTEIYKSLIFEHKAVMFKKYLSRAIEGCEERKELLHECKELFMYDEYLKNI